MKAHKKENLFEKHPKVSVMTEEDGLFWKRGGAKASQGNS